MMAMIIAFESIKMLVMPGLHSHEQLHGLGSLELVKLFEVLELADGEVGGVGS
jgi:hypothetical protein